MIIDVNPNYIVVEGKLYREGLPELIEKGFTGFTIADYIENFVDAIKNNKTEKIKFFLEDKNRTYWDSVDSICYHKDTFIVRPNSPSLQLIKPNTPLIQGVLPLEKDGYSEFGKEYSIISREKPGLILDTQLTSEQFRTHEVWNKLLQGRQDLQNESAEYLFKYFGEKGYTKIMGIYLPNSQEIPLERTWCLRYLDCRPDAVARDSLDSSARFFGWREKNFGS